MTTGTISTNELIMGFSPRNEGQTSGEYLIELKALTEKDKIELASAIARQNNVKQENLAFTMVDY